MATLLVTNNRADFLKIFPKHGVIAEIGVDRADYSGDLLQHLEPSKFYLIDPWVGSIGNNDSVYTAGPNPDEVVDTRLGDVQELFKAEIEAGVIELKRAYSNVCAPEFPYQFFDFVYVDGNHAYSAVLNDLRLYYPRTKDGGFIAGHDFANHMMPNFHNFGVIEAVCDFVRESDAELIMITGGSFPTYVIAHPHSQPAKHLIARAYLELGAVALIDDIANLRFSTELVGMRGPADMVLLPKFGPR